MSTVVLAVAASTETALDELSNLAMLEEGLEEGIF